MRFTKKVFMITALVLILMGTLFAQAEKGDKEISAAASFMSIKAEYGDSITGMNLYARIGYFLNKNLEIESELVLGKMEDVDMGYVFSLNLAINFPTGSKVVPFILGGAGIGNSTWFFVPNVVFFGGEDSLVKVFNAGAGVKVFISKTAAFRAEYRFQRFSAEGSYVIYHLALIGVSIFLK